MWTRRRSCSPSRHHGFDTLSLHLIHLDDGSATIDRRSRTSNVRRRSHYSSHALCSGYLVGHHWDSYLYSILGHGSPHIQHGLVEFCKCSLNALAHILAFETENLSSQLLQTFPLASLAICTARLAIELNSLTLKIVYTCFAALNFALWVFVAIPTAKGFFSGDLLIAPCIADLPLDPLLKQNNDKSSAKPLESHTSNSTQSPDVTNNFTKAAV